MSLAEFRTKDKYAQSRQDFTSYALRQAFVEAERVLQVGRTVNYDALKSDPAKLSSFNGKVGETLLEIAKKAFPAGVIDWAKLSDPGVTPQQRSESIDDITNGLFGLGAKTVTGLAQEIAKETDVSFEALYGTAAQMAKQGLSRHVEEAYKELSGTAALAEFKSTIVDADAITALEEHNGYQPRIMGALVKMYDSVNKGKAPTDIRKMSKEEVTKLLQKAGGN